MATLICTKYPDMAIYDPADASWTKFFAGRLDIEPDDPHYQVVMDEATRNPAIAVYQSISTCVHCGENFKSKAELGKHVKDIHFDVWAADQDAQYDQTRVAEIKARGQFFCDAGDHAEFATEEELALHVSVMHTAKPSDSDAGDGGAAGDVDDVKAAAAGGAASRRAKSAAKEPAPAETS